MKVEYTYGKSFKIFKKNPLLGPTTDMHELEFWEKRLKRLEVDFAVAYQKEEGVINYYIFTKGGKI